MTSRGPRSLRGGYARVIIRLHPGAITASTGMSTMSARTSPHAYFAALAAAALVPLAVFGVLAELDCADENPILFAGAVSCILALAFGLKWPYKAWRWGLWVSGGFGLLLVLAFIGLFRAGRVDVQPLLEALAVMLSACAAGAVGGRVATSGDPRTSASPSGA